MLRVEVFEDTGIWPINRQKVDNMLARFGAEEADDTPCMVSPTVALDLQVVVSDLATARLRTAEKIERDRKKRKSTTMTFKTTVAKTLTSDENIAILAVNESWRRVNNLKAADLRAYCMEKLEMGELSIQKMNKKGDKLVWKTMDEIKEMVKSLLEGRMKEIEAQMAADRRRVASFTLTALPE